MTYWLCITNNSAQTDVKLCIAVNYIYRVGQKTGLFFDSL